MKIPTTIKKYIPTALYTLLGIFVIGLICWFVTPKPTISTDSQNRIDSLTKQIVILKDSIDYQNGKILEYEDAIDILDSLVAVDRFKIKYIYEEVDKKIPIINNYNSDDISKYFINRYGTSK